MMDLDNSCVNGECAMMCTDIHYEDECEDIIMYSDQRVSTEEHKATYGKSTKTESEVEEEVNYYMALCANDSMSLEKKRRPLNKNVPDKNVYGVSQSDVSINENTTVNSLTTK